MTDPLYLDDVLSSGDLASLSADIKAFIRQGQWALIRLPDGAPAAYAVRTEAYCACCNRRPQNTHALDRSGRCTGADLSGCVGGTMVIGGYLNEKRRVP